MKRLLLSFMAAGGFALMAASPALAVNPLCGHSYAITITGANPTNVNQDGSPTHPGALTNAVAVGVMTFDATCAVNTGEMILNDGDTQSSGDPGIFSGPAHCYDNFGLLNSFSAQNGIPCFDGGNHMSSIVVTNPGAFGNGSQDLKFTANQVWTNGTTTASSQSYDFTIQPSTGGATIVGGSVSPAASPGVSGKPPILTITMQKQKVPCGTVFGVAPFLGNSVVSGSSFGANGSDLVASSISAGGNGSFNGGYDTTVGAVEFFNATQAGGSISLNANDSVELSAGTFPTGTNDCSFDLTPGNNCTAFINAHCTTAATGADGVGPYAGCTGMGTGTNSCAPEPASASFADCTANTIAIFTTSGSSCSLTTTNPGVGFAQSSAVWGTTDTNGYFTNTAFISGAQAALGGASGFTPGVGSMGAGLTIAQTPAGKLTTGLTATQALTSTAAGVPVSKVIKITNTSPADCVINTAFTGGTTSDANCTLSITNAASDSPGDTTETTSAALPPPGGAPTFVCTCSGVEDAGLTATAQITSPNCPIAVGGTAQSVTCNN